MSPKCGTFAKSLSKNFNSCYFKYTKYTGRQNARHLQNRILPRLIEISRRRKIVVSFVMANDRFRSHNHRRENCDQRQQTNKHLVVPLVFLCVFGTTWELKLVGPFRGRDCGFLRREITFGLVWSVYFPCGIMAMEQWEPFLAWRSQCTDLNTLAKFCNKDKMRSIPSRMRDPQV